MPEHFKRIGDATVIYLKPGFEPGTADDYTMAKIIYDDGVVEFAAHQPDDDAETWRSPSFPASDAETKHDPKTGQFTGGGAATETAHHRLIKRTLARQGSYSSSGRRADYRAARELAKADPSLKLEEKLEGGEYNKYRQTQIAGSGKRTGSYEPVERTWKLSKT